MSETNELKVIDERIVLGKNFRIFGTFDEPLFLAKDVAEWIEYDKSSINKMLSQIDDDERVRKIVPTLGGGQDSWLLTEEGLYEVLMLSRKPVAKAFKKHVKEILKTIRTTGGFVADGREPEFVAKYFPSFSEDVKLMMVHGMVTSKRTIEQNRHIFKVRFIN